MHRLREGLKAERTACINRIRGLLAEFGLAYAQGPEPGRVLSDVLEDASHEMNTLARRVIQRAQAQWRELDEHMAWCDERIAQHAHDNPMVKAAARLMGIGAVGASAAVATVDDFRQFRCGAQFGAWRGSCRASTPAAAGRSSGASRAAATATSGACWCRERSGGVHGAQTLGPDQPLGVRTARALGLAEGRGGAGQQERAHPVGGDDPRRSHNPNHVSVKPGAAPAHSVPAATA